MKSDRLAHFGDLLNKDISQGINASINLKEEERQAMTEYLLESNNIRPCITNAEGFINACGVSPMSVTTNRPQMWSNAVYPLNFSGRNEHFGQSVNDIVPGDIIAINDINDLLIRVPEVAGGKRLVCHCCLKFIPSLACPCPYCSAAVFCSFQCQRIGWDQFHK